MVVPSLKATDLRDLRSVKGCSCSEEGKSVKLRGCFNAISVEVEVEDECAARGGVV